MILVKQGYIFGGDVLQTIELDTQKQEFKVTRERLSDDARTVDKINHAGVHRFVSAFTESDKIDFFSNLEKI